MPGADDLPGPEIARRSPVWQALSDLFLDTELQPYNHRHIADAIRRAGYSVAEAEAILRDEVAPVLFTNLLSVAGEWAPWSDAYVRKVVLEGLSRSRRKAKSWARFVWPRKFLAERRMAMVRHDWDKVKSLLSPPETRG